MVKAEYKDKKDPIYSKFKNFQIGDRIEYININFINKLFDLSQNRHN